MKERNTKRLKKKSRPFVRSYLFKFILSSTTLVYFCSEELLSFFNELTPTTQRAGIVLLPEDIFEKKNRR